MTMTNELPRYAVPMPRWLMTRKPPYIDLTRVIAYEVRPLSDWLADRDEWVRVAEGWKS